MSRLSAIGLYKRGVKVNDWTVLGSQVLPSTLVEVAFHTNAILNTGQTVTDEEFLRSSTGSAAFALYKAIKDYYENQ